MESEVGGVSRLAWIITNFREELVDNSVMDASAARQGTSGAANGVNLVKYDDVESTGKTHLLLLSFCFSEKIPDIGLRFSNILVQNLCTSKEES